MFVVPGHIHPHRPIILAFPLPAQAWPPCQLLLPLFAHLCNLLSCLCPFAPPPKLSLAGLDGRVSKQQEELQLPSQLKAASFFKREGGKVLKGISLPPPPPPPPHWEKGTGPKWEEAVPAVGTPKKLQLASLSGFMGMGLPHSGTPSTSQTSALQQTQERVPAKLIKSVINFPLKLFWN